MKSRRKKVACSELRKFRSVDVSPSGVETGSCNFPTDHVVFSVVHPEFFYIRRSPAKAKTSWERNSKLEAKRQTSNLRKAHATRDSSITASWAILWCDVQHTIK